jgi:hypothetical protein
MALTLSPEILSSTGWSWSKSASYFRFSSGFTRKSMDSAADFFCCSPFLRISISDQVFPGRFSMPELQIKVHPKQPILSTFVY